MTHDQLAIHRVGSLADLDDPTKLGPVATAMQLISQMFVAAGFAVERSATRVDARSTVDGELFDFYISIVDPRKHMVFNKGKAALASSACTTKEAINILCLSGRFNLHGEIPDDLPDKCQATVAAFATLMEHVFCANPQLAGLLQPKLLRS